VPRGVSGRSGGTVGYLVAALAYAFHVGGLALAPLSLVQAVLAAGSSCWA
jgi:hypothetical protein